MGTVTKAQSTEKQHLLHLQLRNMACKKLAYIFMLGTLFKSLTAAPLQGSEDGNSIDFEEVLVISKSGSEPIIDVRTPAELDQTGKIPVQDIKNVFENMPDEAFLEVYGFDKPEMDEP